MPDQPIHLTGAPVRLRGFPLHPIPNDEVELYVVLVDRDVIFPPCEVPKHVAAIVNTWQKVRVTEMVHWGTSHFQQIDIDLGETETEYLARCRKVWSAINDYKPKAVNIGGRDRLTLKEQNNSDDQGTVTEILGACMGILIAARIFSVPLAAFSKRNYGGSMRHDFDIQLDPGVVLLEVRGRFHRQAAATAIEEIDEKFKRTFVTVSVPEQKKPKIIEVVGPADYSRAIGILGYPSDKADRTIPDIEIMDPESTGRSSTDGERARRILTHYRALLHRQNLRVVGELDRLIGLSNQDLESELRSGISLFTDPSNYLPRRSLLLFGRTRIRIGPEEYLGTYFDAASSPTWIQDARVPKVDGIFFWGIWRGVLERLGSFRILDLLNAAPGNHSGLGPRGSVVVLLDDCILTAWSPTVDDLKADLLDMGAAQT